MTSPVVVDLDKAYIQVPFEVFSHVIYILYVYMHIGHLYKIIDLHAS